MIDILKLKDELGCDELELLIRGEFVRIRVWWDAGYERLVQLIPIVELQQTRMSQHEHVLAVLRSNIERHDWVREAHKALSAEETER